MTGVELINRYHALRKNGLTIEETANTLNRDPKYLLRLERSYRKKGGKYCSLCGHTAERIFCSFTCYMASGLDSGPWILAKARYLTRIKLRE